MVNWLFFIFIVLSSCSSENKNNKCTVEKEFYEDGQIKREEFYIKDKSLFLAKTYYRKNGSLRSIVHFRTENKDSIMKFTTFTTDSLLKFQFDKINNKIDGQALLYHSNGVLAEVENYKNGKLNGKDIYYDKSGEIVKIEYYNDDSLAKEVTKKEILERNKTK